MVDDETDAWLDTLAGRRGGGADARADSEAHLLRSAILARSSEAVDEVAARDPAREEALVSRARAAGLLPQADAAVRLRSPAAAGPLRRMPRAARWLAAAAVAGLAIGLTLQLSPHRPTPVLRGGASVTRIGATDPPALQQQLIRELEATGVHARGYESFGRAGLDADLPTPLPDRVRGVLERHGIPVPADHVLQVEIEPAATP